MRRFREFLIDLKRRHVYRVAAVYLVVAFALLEAADLVLPALSVPEWVFTFLVILTVGGFPFALVLAWAFELTPEGVRREPPRGTVERSAGVLPALAGLIGLVALAAGLGWWVFGRDAAGVPARPGADPVTIVVLPPDAIGGGDAEGEFAQGLYEEIRGRLGRIRDFRVTSRTSAEAFDRAASLRELAASLGASMALESSVRRAGERFRVTAQLVDAASDVQRWSGSYTATYSVDDLFDIQSDIALRVAEELEANLAAPEREALRRRPTDEMAAYEAYVRGRAQLETWSSVGVEQALQYFREAVGIDPDFALAHAGIAEAIAYAVTSQGYDEVMLVRGRDAAERALALAPEQGEAHTALGILHYWGEGDFRAALRAFQRGLELSPSDANAHHWYSHLLMDLGRVEEALAVSRQGLRLDPLSPAMNLQWGFALYYARLYPDAVSQLRRTLEMEEYPGAADLIALSLAWGGRTEEAREELEEIARRWPDSTLPACALVVVGRQAEVRSRLQRLVEAGTAPSATLAALHACLGDEEEALAALQASVEEGDPPLSLAVSPGFDLLRDDPRFQAILREFGLPPEPVEFPDALPASVR